MSIDIVLNIQCLLEYQIVLDLEGSLNVVLNVEC